MSLSTILSSISASVNSLTNTANSVSSGQPLVDLSNTVKLPTVTTTSSVTTGTIVGIGVAVVAVWFIIKKLL